MTFNFSEEMVTMEGANSPAPAWTECCIHRKDRAHPTVIREYLDEVYKAPFKPKDVELFSIISAFDAAYGAYNAYQNGMERFWTLQYLKQHHITELSATVFKVFPGQPPMARADDLPLVLPVLGGGELPRGELEAVVGTGDRQARRVAASLIDLGVLTAESSRAPLRMAFPATLASRWMPGLFPDKPR
jgi:hypothetical protein